MTAAGTRGTEEPQRCLCATDGWGQAGKGEKFGTMGWNGVGKKGCPHLVLAHRLALPSPGILHLLLAGGFLFKALLHFALQDTSPACAVSITSSFLSCPRNKRRKEFTSLF